VTLYTYNEYVQEARLRRKQRKKERKKAHREYSMKLVLLK